MVQNHVKLARDGGHNRTRLRRRQEESSAEEDNVARPSGWPWTGCEVSNIASRVTKSALGRGNLEEEISDGP